MLFSFKRAFPMLAIVVVASLLLAPIEASASCVWSISPSPNKADNNSFVSVSADSANDAWAVGEYSIIHPNRLNDNFPLAEHWNGTNWHIVDSPSTSFQSGFNAVAALTPKDAWVVGSDFYIPKPLIEHWNGATWSMVGSPAEGGLFALKAIWTNNIWAVGSTVANKTLIEHWNGSQWAVVPSPNVSRFGNQLSSITATGPKDVWAVGSYTTTAGHLQTLAEHWNGIKWCIVPTPNANGTRDNILKSVSALSPNDVFAVGYYDDASGVRRSLAEHWNGSRWIIQTTPNPGTVTELDAAAGVSPTEVIAAGVIDTSQPQPYASRWTGSRWVTTLTAIPTNGGSLWGASTIPGTSDVWAAGFIGGFEKTLIERYHC